MLARTDSPHAPWVIVEATDRYFTRTKVIETIIRALETRLGDKAPPSPPNLKSAIRNPKSKREAAHA
jgi:hypothetical protein